MAKQTKLQSEISTLERYITTLTKQVSPVRVKEMEHNRNIGRKNREKKEKKQLAQKQGLIELNDVHHTNMKRKNNEHQDALQKAYKYKRADMVSTYEKDKANDIKLHKEDIQAKKQDHKKELLEITHKNIHEAHEHLALEKNPGSTVEHDQHNQHELAAKKIAASEATTKMLEKHPEAKKKIAAANAHAEVAKHHLKASATKAAHHLKAAHKNTRNSSHGSGDEFKRKQAESNNLIYLEQAIDDEANEPSSNTLTFEGEEYKRYGNKTDFISSLEDKLGLLNGPLVSIVNEFYDTIDPLTLSYLNKLIATSIPLIDRLKLYIFLASLIPEFGEAFAVFLETMNPFWLNIYTTNLNHNMKGLFYKHGDVLQTKRANSLQKTAERVQALKAGIKSRAKKSMAMT